MMKKAIGCFFKLILALLLVAALFIFIMKICDYIFGTKFPQENVGKNEIVLNVGVDGVKLGDKFEDAKRKWGTEFTEFLYGGSGGLILCWPRNGICVENSDVYYRDTITTITIYDKGEHELINGKLKVDKAFLGKSDKGISLESSESDIISVLGKPQKEFYDKRGWGYENTEFHFYTTKMKKLKRISFYVRISGWDAL
ncbi:MAG: hypothetical protein ABIH66_01275 [bacterium]